MAEKTMVGAAEVQITPPVGTELAGYFHPRVSDGVIIDLMAKAVVVGEDDPVAICACDLITMTAEISGAAREIIEEATDIPGERVMICSTHTHTGPELRPNRPIARNEEWVKTLPGLIAEAVIKAAENRQEAYMYVGSEPEEGLAFNRRFRYTDGREEFGIRDDEEKVVGPAGPTDPELGVVAFRTDHGEDPFAVICNYSLHIDVTGGNKISADFPGVMTELLRETYGDDLIMLYVQGACGNINHVPYLLDRPWPRKGHEKSVQVGRALGGKAVCIAEKALPTQSASVDAYREILQVSKYPIDEVVEMRLEAARQKEEPHPAEIRMMERMEDYDPDEIIPRETQAIRLGDVVFCSAPGEYFVEWGLEIKGWSPFEYTFIAELANDSVGYIPTWEAFRRGGYEATPICSVISTPALGQMIADAQFRACQTMWERLEE
ncbi:MAG: hypothetical protein R6V19_17065 [Armatimonadota bacterium]